MAHAFESGQDFDPFERGRVLTLEDCRRRLAELSDGRLEFALKFLAAAPTRQVLVRMLTNLKRIYVEGRYYRKAIGIIDRLLAISPRAYEEVRDRGALYAELKQFGLARDDLETYLRYCKDRQDAEAVRRAIQHMDGVLTLMDD